MSTNSLFSVFFLQDINSIIQSFLPGTMGKHWKDPDTAAKAGHLHLLHNFTQNGQYCTRAGIDWAIEFQHEEVFYYLLKQGISWSENALGMVSFNGNTNILGKMLEMRTHRFSNHHADVAASKGNIKAVYIFYENGLKCTHNGANLAAKDGHIDMLRILHTEYGVKCSDYGFFIAAKTNRPKVIKYLMDEQGLNCSSTITDVAIRLKCKDVVNFLISRGIYGTLEGWTYPLPERFYTFTA